MFDHVRRSLDFGLPVPEGEGTIAVADIIGTVGRIGDFDGCFQPKGPTLAARIEWQAGSVGDQSAHGTRTTASAAVSPGPARLALAATDDAVHRTGVLLLGEGTGIAQGAEPIDLIGERPVCAAPALVAS